MKNILFNIMASVCVLVCCISQSHAQAVSKAEAQAVATHFFQQCCGQPNAQLTLKRMNAIKGQSAPSDAFFLFEPTLGPGFVLVSADKNAPPILAYSDRNFFDAEHVAPQTEYMLSLYEAQISEIRQQRIQAEPKVKADWEALYNNTYHAPEDPLSAGPFLTTTWDQGGFYNQFCPTNKKGPSIMNAVTGCVATSLAQIIRYWRFPNGVDYHQVHLIDNDIEDLSGGVNTDQVTIDSTIWLGGGYIWNNMPNAMTTATPSDISRLMLHAGFSVGMDYGVGGSEAWGTSIAPAMHDHFGYELGNYVARSSMSEASWHSALQESLNNGVPLLYTGPGHAWVCDGFSTNLGSHWYHMNWGWGGSGDGFYSLNALTVQGHNYNSNQKAVFGLKPPGCPISSNSTGVAIGSIEVAQTITATSTIAVLPGLNVTFDAGESIVLLPGFVAPNGANFTALIEGCGGVFFNPEEEAEGRSDDPAAAQPSRLNESEAVSFVVAPNPFSEHTVISYSLENEQSVSIELLDALGRLVATPLPAQRQGVGEHQFRLDAGNLPAGLYFLSMRMGEKRETRRLILTR